MMRYALPIACVAITGVHGKWEKGYPPSCECKETGVSARDCTIFSCDCTCNITPDECDYGCCCDPDCSADQISRFEELNACTDYASTKSSVNKCYDADSLKKAERGAPMRGGITSRDAVDEMLCVSKQNNNFQGYFYKDTGSYTSNVFNTPAGTVEYSFEAASESQPVSASLVDAYYDLGDFIPAYVNVSNSYMSTAGGFFTVPQVDFSGMCNDNAAAEFETDVSGTCGRLWSSSIDSFQMQCELGFGAVSSYAGDITLLAQPDDDSSIAANQVPVLVNTVYFLDYFTGSRFDVTAAWTSNNCSTSFNTTKAACQFGIPMQDSNCWNAVVGVEYSILHAKDAYSTITGAKSTITVSNIPFDAESGFPTTQAFSLDFYESASAFSNPTSQNRSVSGNPGYLTGLPVLFGAGNVAASTVTQDINGLRIQSPVPDSASAAVTAGECPSESSYSSFMNTMTVKFGYDVSTGCVMYLNRSAFKDFCCDGKTSCTGDSPYVGSSAIPYFLTPTVGYIGMYGNADPTDITQWFQLAAAMPAASSGSWDENGGVCTGAVTGVNYKFYVVQTGEKANPQSKIVAAVVDYSTQDIIIRTSPNDASSVQGIPLSVTVTFINSNEQSAKGYNPPPPPVLFTVPYDIFYPFGIDSANSAHSSAGSFIGIALVATVTLAVSLFVM